jgi:hypothetical protein
MKSSCAGTQETNLVLMVSTAQGEQHPNKKNILLFKLCLVEKSCNSAKINQPPLPKSENSSAKNLK